MSPSLAPSWKMGDGSFSRCAFSESSISPSSIIRWSFVFAEEVNVPSKDCVNAQSFLLVGGMAFPSCSDKLPLPLSPLCT